MGILVRFQPPHAIIRGMSSSHYNSFYSITCCWQDVALAGFGKTLCSHCSDLKVSVTSDESKSVSSIWQTRLFSPKPEECWECKEVSWNLNLNDLFTQHTLSFMLYLYQASNSRKSWFSCLLSPKSAESGKSLNKCNDLRQSHCHHPLPLREEDKGRSVCLGLCVVQLVSHWILLFLRHEAYDSQTNTTNRYNKWPNEFPYLNLQVYY